jgi:hypothetical protein
MLNNQAKTRLFRFQKILDAVPFSKSRTNPGSGFEEDMRSIRLYLDMVLNGMLLEGVVGYERGEDFEDVDQLLGMLEEWVREREHQDWKEGDSTSFLNYWQIYLQNKRRVHE